ncbi:putative nuclease HARBI1 [Prorops nasuta]|uniref:putative nuclease HARBI1 n=1 Tax=Prorops nasuta TaxID=863751 RepID=UPI0034D01D16
MGRVTLENFNSMDDFEFYVIQHLFDNENDEDDNVLKIRHRRSPTIRKRFNYIEIYNDKEFQLRFRLSKKNVIMILQKIIHKLHYDSERNNPISPIIQLLMMFRFAATGSFILSIADFCGISQSSGQRIIHKVSLSIAELHKEYIKFPTNNDMLMNKIQNFNVSGFIRVIGAIDCVHILDLVAHWPGATHDATIFDNSRIKTRFESNEFGNGVLLGDSGYPCLSYLLTPLLDPRTPAEVLYNESQIRTRCMVERCFGVMGRMFPVLTVGSRFWTPQKTLPLITACAVLYNVTRLTSEANDINIEEYCNFDRVLNEDLHDNERAHLITNYFERLL